MSRDPAAAGVEVRQGHGALKGAKSGSPKEARARPKLSADAKLGDTECPSPIETIKLMTLVVSNSLGACVLVLLLVMVPSIVFLRYQMLSLHTEAFGAGAGGSAGLVSESAVMKIVAAATMLTVRPQNGFKLTSPRSGLRIYAVMTSTWRDGEAAEQLLTPRRIALRVSKRLWQAISSTTPARMPTSAAIIAWCGEAVTT